MAYRTAERTAADELCSCRHLNERLGTRGDTRIARFLGLDEMDMKWVTLYGQDVTALCEESSIGGFSSSRWSLQGWVLDEASLQNLREEFPDRYPTNYHPLPGPAGWTQTHDWWKSSK